MAIKILHTADWQIGQKASHVAAVASVVRGARLEAARAAIDVANAERVHAVVLAGDQFEDNLVEDRLVHEVNAILARSHAPVYVLPGNHDALTHDSIYFRSSWRSGPAHVTLLQSRDPVSIPGTDGWLLPAPLFQKRSSEDPTSVLRPFDGQGIRIGVAHGSLRIEGKYSEDDFPIDLKAPGRLGIDYLALGHWHGHFAHEGRAVYSGTQETCNFGEKNSGQALLVEIDSPGAAARLREARTGRLRWMTCDLDFDLGTEAALQQLRSRLAAIERPEAVLLRIRTRGQSTADLPLELQRFEDEIAARFLHVTIQRRDVPSAALEGRLAELAARYPLVEGLLSGIMSRGLPVEETGPALQMLFEILSTEER